MLNKKSKKLNLPSRINIPGSSTVKHTTGEIFQTSKESCIERCLSPQKKIRFHLIIELCRALSRKPGVHSLVALAAAGFHYTNIGDTARCDDCKLEISQWTLDMKPFVTHSQRSPNCPFVRSILPDEIIPQSTTNDEEIPAKRQKIEPIQEICQANLLIEINMLKLIRKRTFSNWSSRTSPLSAQMITAGFFACNVGDRVICLYCNLICQSWISNTYDPLEVHKALSPKCPFIIAIVKGQQASSLFIINEYSTNDHSLTSNSIDPFRSNEIVFTAACHPAFIEVPKRGATFSTWPNENLPAVDDLVRAGFFYTGTKTVVTCFYCSGSLQNWGPNDNPTVEHARWFPHCAYIKQLCGPELYRKIQESKQAHQERNRLNATNEQSTTDTVIANRGQLIVPDESTLARYVAARLDLFISQFLLNKNVKLSIIKRCWEDQLRLKHDDFVDDCDLRLATMILQKQIDRIDGKKENITIPNVAMDHIRQKAQEVVHDREQAGSSSTLADDTSNTNDTDMSPSPNESNAAAAAATTEPQAENPTPSAMDASPTNPCVLCFTEEKRLACIPCGHFATCVACGHSLRSCPICRREINAFVRIYL